MKIIKGFLLLLCLLVVFMAVSMVLPTVIPEDFPARLAHLFGVSGAENTLNMLADFTMITSFLITLGLFVAYRLFFSKRSNAL